MLVVKFSPKLKRGFKTIYFIFQKVLTLWIRTRIDAYKYDKCYLWIWYILHINMLNIINQTISIRPPYHFVWRTNSIIFMLNNLLEWPNGALHRVKIRMSNTWLAVTPTYVFRVYWAMLVAVWAESASGLADTAFIGWNTIIAT